jgi:hypothetical protein
MSALSSRRYRVTIIEWISYVGVIEAASSDEAEEMALDIRGTDAENDMFSFKDSGVSDVLVEKIRK